MRVSSFLLSFLVCCSSHLCFALSGNHLLEKLTQVNSEWLKQAESNAVVNAADISTPKNYNQWIAAHLTLVEQTLRARDVSKLSATQQQNRHELLNKLKAYRMAAVFPTNDYVAYKTPVFIDRKGTHCAVGYLMQQSGEGELARHIDNTQKFAFVHQIKADGVKEWAAKNGFTIDELAWIQPAYQTTIPSYNMEGGLDGTVNTIIPDALGLGVIAAGSFSKTDKGVTCNNIAAWVSGFAGFDWVSVGDGVNGTVHALLLNNLKLYAAGEFSMAGNVAAGRVAVYDITAGQWQAMGSLDSTVRALAFYKGELYAAGDFTGFVAKWNGTNWQDVSQGMLYGNGARTLQVWDTLLMIGGDFELATGAIRKNVAAYNGSYITLMGMGTTTPVNDFEIHKGKLYAACDVVNGTDTCALAVFEDFDWKVVLKPFYGIADEFQGNAILKLHSTGNSLLAAGDFSSAANMFYGKNVMEIKTVTYPGDTNVYTQYVALAATDLPVRALAVDAQTLYFGGQFVANYGTDTLNHVAYQQLTPTSVQKIENASLLLKVFPNPANDMVALQTSLHSTIDKVEIFDALGRKIWSENMPREQNRISVKNLADGLYTIHAFSNNKWHQAKMMKW